MRRRASSRLMPLRWRRSHRKRAYASRVVRERRDLLAIAEEHGERDAVVDEDGRGTNDLELLTLRQHDLPGRANGAIDDPANEAARASEARLEPLAVFVHVAEVARDAA